MDEGQITRLETSFDHLAPRADELVDRFYTNLFEKAPAVRSMFQDDLTEQKKKLVESLVLVVQNLRKSEQLVDPLKKMGARHAEYGAVPEHYGVVRDVLLSTMAQMAGDVWTDELNEDWTGALNTVVELMLRGADEADACCKAA